MNQSAATKSLNSHLYYLCENVNGLRVESVLHVSGDGPLVSPLVRDQRHQHRPHADGHEHVVKPEAVIDVVLREELEEGVFTFCLDFVKCWCCTCSNIGSDGQLLSQ